MKKIIAFIACILITGFGFSQNQFTLSNVSWSTVLDGKVITDPVVTSYGFCVVSDSRNICAYSNNGKLLWSKALHNARKANIFSIYGDFIVSLESSNLSVLNPSGTQIWMRNLDYEPYLDVIQGFDGRFFIHGKTQIECYSMNGKRRWSIEVPELSMDKIQTLPDGSLLAIKSSLDSGKSVGLRISPYGKILEEITFNGEIKNMRSSTEGLLIIFEDNTAGLLGLSKNLTDNFHPVENRWTLIENLEGKKKFFLTVPSLQEVYLFCDGTNEINVGIIKLSTGTLVKNFKIKNLSTNELRLSYLSSNGIFLADSKNGIFVNTEGQELLSGSFQNNSRQNISHIICLQNDTFISFSENWSINAWRLSQSSIKKASKEVRKNKYTDFGNKKVLSNSIYFIDENLLKDERFDELILGDYGEKEILYVNQLKDVCQAYENYLQSSNVGTRTEQSYFEINNLALGKCIRQLSFVGTDEFISLQAKILKNTPDDSIRKMILNGVSHNGYDPDSQLLSAIEYIVIKNSRLDDATIITLCDATYSICLFMGRPAFNSKGKEILKKYLYPSYSAKVNEYARNTFMKIGKLDL